MYSVCSETNRNDGVWWKPCGTHSSFVTTFNQISFVYNIIALSLVSRGGLVRQETRSSFWDPLSPACRCLSRPFQDRHINWFHCKLSILHVRELFSKMPELFIYNRFIVESYAGNKNKIIPIHTGHTIRERSQFNAAKSRKVHPHNVL